MIILHTEKLNMLTGDDPFLILIIFTFKKSCPVSLALTATKKRSMH